MSSFEGRVQGQRLCLPDIRASLSTLPGVSLPCRPSPGGGELVSTLVLAYTFGLPRADERCRRQLLSDIAQLPDRVGEGAGRAEALAALAELPAGTPTAELMLTVLLRGGEDAAKVAKLQQEVSSLSARCAAYQQAVASHVREFYGASAVRDAINAHVHPYL